MTTAQLQAFARAVALRNGVNPAVFLRQISQESGWNPNARSSAGAEGIAQIMPGTAASWGVNPMNPREALAAAAHHDAEYLRAYHGSYQKMLAAYNAGPGAVASGAWRGYSQTTNYVRSILSGIGNPHNFQGGGAAGPGMAPVAGGSVTTRGNPGAAMAALSLIRPISVSLPQTQLPQAQATLGSLLQPQQPQQPDTTEMPSQSVPTGNAGSELNAIHSKLLGM